jgi:hypothetical protein
MNLRLRRAFRLLGVVTALGLLAGDRAGAEIHFAATREYGIDAHSINADPQFADVSQGDFRLDKDSPVLSLGVEPIAMTRSGLSKDHPYRRAKP